MGDELYNQVAQHPVRSVQSVNAYAQLAIQARAVEWALGYDSAYIGYRVGCRESWYLLSGGSLLC